LPLIVGAAGGGQARVVAAECVRQAAVDRAAAYESKYDALKHINRQLEVHSSIRTRPYTEGPLTHILAPA
jgi:hypothetical protein